jgi:hypothetical protein
MWQDEHRCYTGPMLVQAAIWLNPAHRIGPERANFAAADIALQRRLFPSSGLANSSASVAVLTRPQVVLTIGHEWRLPRPVHLRLPLKSSNVRNGAGLRGSALMLVANAHLPSSTGVVGRPRIARTGPARNDLAFIRATSIPLMLRKLSNSNV